MTRRRKIILLTTAFAVAGIAGLSVSAYVWLRSRAVPRVEEQPA